MKVDDHPELEREVRQVAEADSLAAMQARKREASCAQRKMKALHGRDFGHDYSCLLINKRRRDAEFKSGLEIEPRNEGS